ncbi:MAG TPA: sugar ABC transporter ATP-binding protein [Candidatus Hydrogenedentes bacterium]|nr:sugar ABC transporter ATP-binding protein [Candidatus Hydrogenedentota bacterium]
MAHSPENGRIILEMRGVSKSFPGVKALDRVDLEVRAGEAHCLVGENGAGKSTLMKILAGAVPLDEGEIRIDGEPVHIRSPHHAQQLGISMIYQEFNLSPFLSVAENIFLGREPRYPHTPFVNWPAMYDQARDLLRRINVDLDVRRSVNELSIAQQQMVEIAKALSFQAKIIVMDEPSATLTEHELNALFNLIRELKRQGVGIVYISHRLEELFETGDRVTVMRDGKYVGRLDIAEITQRRDDPDRAAKITATRDAIIRMMVARKLDEGLFPKETFERGEEVLRVEGLCRYGVFHDISFALHKGEIVGLTGLVGAGRTEVARAIFGADPLDEGAIHLYGKRITVRSPQDAIRHGIGLLTEDRKNQGLILGMSVRENTTLANLSELLRGLVFLDKRRERDAAAKLARDLEIRAPSVETVVQTLSGGNQQKVVLAKWLFTRSKVLIFDEPTRGIDVGAKVAIYELMNTLVRRGVAVLIISSEMLEVIGMCDRVLVMNSGWMPNALSGELRDWPSHELTYAEVNA